jgi:hypothetical protein
MAEAISMKSGSEFAGHKLLVMSSAIGLTTSMNAAMFYSLGSFMVPLKEAFGWERGVCR